MAENSGMSAIVAIVAVIAIAIVGYFAVTMLRGDTPTGGTGIEVDLPSGGTGN